VHNSSDASGPRLLEFVQAELTKEEARRTSIESRGLALVTVASGLIALVAAVRQFIGRAGPVTTSAAADVLIVVSGCLLVLGTVAAACTNAPRRYRLIDPDALLEAAPRLWEQSPDEMDRAIFSSQLIFLKDAQHTNDARARLLFVAVILVGIGVIGLAVSSLVGLNH
jgi:hypothetical protein